MHGSSASTIATSILWRLIWGPSSGWRRGQRRPGVFLIAESGVHSREDALRMMQAGADALLVGTELMGRPERLGELNRS